MESESMRAISLFAYSVVVLPIVNVVILTGLIIGFTAIVCHCIEWVMGRFERLRKHNIALKARLPHIVAVSVLFFHIRTVACRHGVDGSQDLAHP